MLGLIARPNIDLTSEKGAGLLMALLLFIRYFPRMISVSEAAYFCLRLSS
jgi:hypothetical protein